LFFFNDSATTKIYTRSYTHALHDALPVSLLVARSPNVTLDLAPKGRDEEGLAYTMAWVRHHDRYDNQPVDVKAQYEPPKVTISSRSAGDNS
jgi:hypothetical protein